MSKRRNRAAALEAVQREQTVSEPAAEHGVHHTMINHWRRSLLKSLTGIFKSAAELAEDVVHDLYAKIGELPVANDFFVQKARAQHWGMRRRIMRTDPS